MKRPSLYVLLASSLVFLASLFLPWRDATVPPVFNGRGAQGLLQLFEGGRVDGWLGIAGDVSVLLVIAIALATVAGLRRPELAARLPIAGLGVALAYFAIAVAHEAHSLAGRLVGGFTGKPPTPHTSWAYGFYLGIASAGIAALSALAFRRSEVLRQRGVGDALAAVLGIGLLVSFCLPWVGFPGAEQDSVHGIESPPAAIAALVLLLGAGRLLGEGARRRRLPCAIATATLSGGAASVLYFGGDHVYGAWIGIGCAVSLVALEAVRALPLQVPALPHGLPAVRAGAAGLVIVALFLPGRRSV
jgi:hypothetical protein